jgi:hypothetical protein
MIGNIVLPNVPKDFELSGKENQDAQPPKATKAPEQIFGIPNQKPVQVPAITKPTTTVPKNPQPPKATKAPEQFFGIPNQKPVQVPASTQPTTTVPKIVPKPAIKVTSTRD